MKAIGRNLVVNISKAGISKTTGCFVLGEKQWENIGYAEGTVVNEGAGGGGCK